MEVGVFWGYTLMKSLLVKQNGFPVQSEKKSRGIYVVGWISDDLFSWEQTYKRLAVIGWTVDYTAPSNFIGKPLLFAISL